MGFPGQEYWSGLPFSAPGDLSDTLQEDSLPLHQGGGNHTNLMFSNSSSQFSSVQLLSHIWLFAIPWSAAYQASLSITNYQSLLWLPPLSRWCHPTISSLVVPFSSCLQSFPASESFQMSQFFTSGGQSIGVSCTTSVLPMNIQDWFPLGWTGWISLQSRDSKESSLTLQFKSINSSVLSFLYSLTLISMHDYWKNHSLD